MSTFKNTDGKSVLLKMVKGIQDNKAYLGEVDGLIGEGDHGMNMNKGFTVFETRFADKATGFTEGLDELGMVLLNDIGGSMGPIYGTFFSKLSKTFKGEGRITSDLFEKAVLNAKEGLMDLAGAQPGDKTLVDTVVPAYEAFKAANAEGKEFSECLNALKEGAKKGKESTKDMVAKIGRAARLGERSKGHLDAGATSCCIILCTMADGIIANLQSE